MGAWGHDSSSSDACWDLLGEGGVEDIHNPKQKEVNKCMKNVMTTDYASDFYPRARLGVAVWLLDHGMTLDDEQLDWALDQADKFLSEYDQAVEAEVTQPDDIYMKTVEAERERILAAKQNSGQGTKHHTKGLFEQIEDKMAESGLGLINVDDKAAEVKDADR